MKNKFSLLLFLLVFSLNAPAQDKPPEKRPQAYLVSSGGKKSEAAPRQAYLLSSGNPKSASARPRIVKTVSSNVNAVSIGKSKDNFRLEQKVFELINKHRAKFGLAVLEWNEEVAKIARSHSKNMANFSFFSHKDLKGYMVNDRADALGMSKWRAIGENIAYNRGYENPAEFAVERWMQSLPHRENLLNNRWKESGIGIAVTEDGTYYFTEVFVNRK